VSSASDSLRVKTPLRVLSQMKLPARDGVMTSGELVAANPTWSPLAMADSNLSSKVIAGAGVEQLVTNST